VRIWEDILSYSRPNVYYKLLLESCFLKRLQCCHISLSRRLQPFLLAYKCITRRLHTRNAIETHPVYVRVCHACTYALLGNHHAAVTRGAMPPLSSFPVRNASIIPVWRTKRSEMCFLFRVLYDNAILSNGWVFFRVFGRHQDCKPLSCSWFSF
jgi:hypothetical protein